MIIRIDYDKASNNAILSAIEKDEWHWNNLVNNLYSSIPTILQFGDSIIIPIDLFIAVRMSIASYAKNHGIAVQLTYSIRGFLSEANLRSYSYAIKQSAVPKENIIQNLKKVGFKRSLTDNQLNNLSKIGNYPSAATFSVPGAGKTTEALAFFFLNAKPDEKLLVVAPKNAFGAWDEQISDCFNDKSLKFERLRGGEDKIARSLKESPRFSIITYQQYPRVSELIMNFLRRNSVYVFLDESHRIKSGTSGISADSILKASYLPVRKLIMSGTPMPQSIKDLIPQFSFLYPDKGVSESTVIDLIRPIYVRTTSGQLGIPPVEHKLVQLQMNPLQYEIYQAIKSETKRQLIPLLSDSSKASLREINKKIMKVMQFVSNPALLARDIDFIFDPRLGDLLSKGLGPKIDYACKRARQLASEGRKVIIWSQFVENVELIATRLKDIGADYIHGGVDAGDEDDTREWKIKEFHQNPQKMVLVANPAAASEGISLHKVCQYAIYVDRSFNAAHYLQSEDRIHRLGLKPDQIPIVEIIECENTIDELIRFRLEQKVETMSQALNDSSLDIGTVQYDVDYEPEDAVSVSDIQYLQQYFNDIPL